NHRVGIGTVTPSAKLNVHGSDTSGIGTGIQTRTRNASVSVNSFASFVAEAAGAVVTQMVADGLGTFDAGTPAGYYGTSTNHPVSLMTNNVPRIRISESGRVGINTSDNRLSLLTLRAKNSSFATGTVSVTNGSSAVTGSGTKFLSEVVEGNRVLLP